MELNYAGDKSYHTGKVKLVNNSSYLWIVLTTILVLGGAGFVYWRKRDASFTKKIKE